MARWFCVAPVLVFVFGCGQGVPSTWPPVMFDPYPDLCLYNHKGEKLQLSSLKGKVLLIEPVGMSCPACQAFAGGNEVGGFGGIEPQRDLDSIHDYTWQFAGVPMDDERLVTIQILCCDLSMRTPSVDDARKWAEHFGFDQRENCYVLAGSSRLNCPETRRMIPGFHLVDREFILRADATGARQRDLYSKLIPMIPELLEEVAE